MSSLEELLERMRQLRPGAFEEPPEGALRQLLERTRQLRPEAFEEPTEGALRRSIAGFLAGLRTLLGLSQRAVAERAEWKQPQVARMEGISDGTPSLESTVRYVEAVGCVPILGALIQAKDGQLVLLAASALTNGKVEQEYLYNLSQEYLYNLSQRELELWQSKSK